MQSCAGLEAHGRLEITNLLRTFFSEARNRKFVLLSPLYDSEHGTRAHYYCSMFAQGMSTYLVSRRTVTDGHNSFSDFIGAKGCTVTLHMWESVLFDEDGFVRYHKIEWQDGEGRVRIVRTAIMYVMRSA